MARGPDEHTGLAASVASAARYRAGEERRQRRRRESLTRLSLTVPSPSGNAPRSGMRSGDRSPARVATAAAASAAAIVGAHSPAAKATRQRVRRSSVERFAGAPPAGPRAAAAGGDNSPASSAGDRSPGSALRRVRRASVTALTALTSNSARTRDSTDGGGDAGNGEAGQPEGQPAGPLTFARRVQRASITALELVSPTSGGEPAPDGEGGPVKKEGRLRRMRRTSIAALASIRMASPSMKMRGQSAQELECRFAGCGCAYTARTQDLLSQHYQQSEDEHTELIRTALHRIEANNEALRSKLETGSESLVNAATAVTVAERASRSTNLQLKKLQRDLRAAAMAKKSKTNVSSVWIDSRLQSLGRDPPGMDDLRKQTAKGKDVVKTLEKSADPYKRLRCGACDCIYTDFANQVATCARHVGEEDVSGRWSCCQKTFTGMHYNGCVLTQHSAAATTAGAAHAWDLPAAAAALPVSAVAAAGGRETDGLGSGQIGGNYNMFLRSQNNSS